MNPEKVELSKTTLHEALDYAFLRYTHSQQVGMKTGFGGLFFDCHFPGACGEIATTISAKEAGLDPEATSLRDDYRTLSPFDDLLISGKVIEVKAGLVKNGTAVKQAYGGLVPQTQVMKSIPDYYVFVQIDGLTAYLVGYIPGPSITKFPLRLDLPRAAYQVSFSKMYPVEELWELLNNPGNSNKISLLPRSK